MTTTLTEFPQTAVKARPMRALLIGVLPLWADRGDAIHLREVAQALQARDIAPTVLCLPGPDAPRNADLPEVRVNVSRRRFQFQLSWNVKATLAGLRAVREDGIDIVYTRLDPGMIAGWLIARLSGKVDSVAADGFTLATDAGKTKVVVPANARIQKVAQATAADIKEGESVQVTGDAGADGVVAAKTVLIMPAGQGAGQGRTGN
jgi:hypothetical protein